VEDRGVVERAHRVFVGRGERDVDFAIGPMPAPSAIQNAGLPARPYPMAWPKSIRRE
jgi:hypothetical protein